MRHDTAGRDFDALVESTANSHNMRSLFHATNASLLIIGALAFRNRPDVLISMLVVLLGVLLVIDAARLWSPAMNYRFFKYFRRIATPRDRDRPASSTWYLLGVLLTLILFPLRPAIAAIAVLGYADPIAKQVGRRIRSPDLGSGTVVGTAVFAGSATVAVALVGYSLPVAATTALLAAAVEAFSGKLDDNLTIPLVTGSLLWLVGRPGFALLQQLL